MKLLLKISTTLLVPFVPAATFAACPPGKLCPPVTGVGTTLVDFIYWLISMIQLVGTPVLVVCIIYAGYLMVTAGGNEEQVTKSKIWIVWTLVGGAIILGATVIAAAIQGTATAL